MDRVVTTGDVVSLSIHGPQGVLDLHVPVGASGLDVATEYSRQASLTVVPALHTPLGAPLDAQRTLAESGVASGSVLVAITPGASTAPPPRRRMDLRPSRRLEPGSLSIVWFALAVATALLAGWFASTLPHDSHLRTATLILLFAAAAVGALPWGPLAEQRVLAAPAFAGAAVFALAWNPTPARLPTILGVAALAAAVAAAVARSLDEHSEQGLRVWMVTGAAFFVIAGLGALVGVESHVVWSVLLAASMLAARLVPLVAIDVPDQYLLDLERLAVTAWSARERPTGRRGRIIVPRQAVAAVADGGRRMVTAACGSILAVSLTMTFLLLRDTHYDLDRIGARTLVGFVGVALLLAARSYRHVGARGMLRAAGVGCLLQLTVVLFAAMSDVALVVVAVAAIALAALVVVVAVALGRGWRSAWWGRRAEVAEAIAGSFALAALVVAVGIFRQLWELTG